MVKKTSQGKTTANVRAKTFGRGLIPVGRELGSEILAEARARQGKGPFFSSVKHRPGSGPKFLAELTKFDWCWLTGVNPALGETKAYFCSVDA